MLFVLNQRFPRDLESKYEIVRKTFIFSGFSWEFQKTWQVFWGSRYQCSQVPTPELCQHYPNTPHTLVLTWFTYVWLHLQVRSQIIFVKLSFWSKSMWNSIRQALVSMLITSSDFAFVTIKIILSKNKTNLFHIGYNFSGDCIDNKWALLQTRIFCQRGNDIYINGDPILQHINGSLYQIGQLDIVKLCHV